MKLNTSIFLPICRAAMKKSLVISLSIIVTLLLAVAGTWFYATGGMNSETQSDFASQSADADDTPSDKVLSAEEASEAVSAWAQMGNNTTPASGAAPETEEPKVEIGGMTPIPAPVADAPSVDQPATTTTSEASTAPADAGSVMKREVESGTLHGPRTLGKADAPVTMIEFSSLTCPHCAAAHKEILPRLITDYVDKGLLRIVFHDFPLNKQALDASKVSRCMSNQAYLPFITVVFEGIEQWAYGQDPQQALVALATLAGLPRDQAMGCLNNAEIEKSLLEDMQKARVDYKVESTPTFVFNDGVVRFSGTRPYADFTTAIESILAAKKP